MLNSLNSELKCSNILLKEKLNMFILKLVNKKPLLIAVYEPVNKHGLIIKLNVSSVSNVDVLNDIKMHIRPSEKKIRIDNIKKSKRWNLC